MESNAPRERVLLRMAKLRPIIRPKPTGHGIVPAMEGPPTTPSRVLYSVTATLPDGSIEAMYVRWLCEGHVQAVLGAGAESARVVRIKEPPGLRRVRSEYVFASPDAFDRYVRDAAPALRADGLARFGPGTGVRMEREIASVLWPFAGR